MTRPPLLLQEKSPEQDFSGCFSKTDEFIPIHNFHKYHLLRHQRWQKSLRTHCITTISTFLIASGMIFTSFNTPVKDTVAIQTNDIVNVAKTDLQQILTVRQGQDKKAMQSLFLPEAYSLWNKQWVASGLSGSAYTQPVLGIPTITAIEYHKGQPAYQITTPIIILYSNNKGSDVIAGQSVMKLSHSLNKPNDLKVSQLVITFNDSLNFKAKELK